jgi:ankyrin repeat protein
VLGGKADNLQLLLKRGANTQLRQKDGSTVQSLAKQQGFKAIEKLLE